MLESEQGTRVKQFTCAVSSSLQQWGSVETGIQEKLGDNLGRMKLAGGCDKLDSGYVLKS